MQDRFSDLTEKLPKKNKDMTLEVFSINYITLHQIVP